MNGTAVRLKIASFSGFAGGGFEGQSSNITAKVQNIALSKDVALHYNDLGIWTEAALSWNAHFGDYDLFSISKPALVEEFVLRYSVGGQTFWDNNNFKNYSFGGRAAVIGGNVVLNKATARRGTEAGGGFVVETSWLEGEIYVNNLSPVKEVGVVLSADGGVTWNRVSAGFAGPAAGTSPFDSTTSELWTFKSPELNLNPASDQFRLAVFHHNVPSGDLFWDNNFGQDYKVSKTDGSMIA
jgi:hypothetical protein